MQLLYFEQYSKEQLLLLDNMPEVQALAQVSEQVLVQVLVQVSEPGLGQELAQVLVQVPEKGLGQELAKVLARVLGQQWVRALGPGSVLVLVQVSVLT